MLGDVGLPDLLDGRELEDEDLEEAVNDHTNNRKILR